MRKIEHIWFFHQARFLSLLKLFHLRELRVENVSELDYELHEPALYGVPKSSLLELRLHSLEVSRVVAQFRIERIWRSRRVGLFVDELDYEPLLESALLLRLHRHTTNHTTAILLLFREPVPEALLWRDRRLRLLGEDLVKLDMRLVEVLIPVTKAFPIDIALLLLWHLRRNRTKTLLLVLEPFREGLLWRKRRRMRQVLIKLAIRLVGGLIPRLLRRIFSNAGPIDIACLKLCVVMVHVVQIALLDSIADNIDVAFIKALGAEVDRRSGGGEGSTAQDGRGLESVRRHFPFSGSRLRRRRFGLLKVERDICLAWWKLLQEPARW
jgi:hypothetical protein